MYDDWNLIEASFAMQYKIRLREENNMTFSEFSTLLSGIMPETPLGKVVEIRAEEDKDMLKNFNSEQHRVRNEWRSRYNPVLELSEEEKEEQITEIQELFKNMFGSST